MFMVGALPYSVPRELHSSEQFAAGRHTTAKTLDAVRSTGTAEERRAAFQRQYKHKLIVRKLIDTLAIHMLRDGLQKI